MIRKTLKEKAVWRDTQKRVKKLPKEYRFVYKEMQKYIFKVTLLSADEVNEIFTTIICLFEQGVLDSKHVLEVTGNDVAAFCDALVEDKASHYDEVTINVESQVLNALNKMNEKK